MTTKSPEQKQLRRVLPEPEEPRSVVDTLDTQQDPSVAGHPRNYVYINSRAFVHILFNQELLEDLIQLDWVIKIQGGGKSIHLS